MPCPTVRGLLVEDDPAECALTLAMLADLPSVDCEWDCAATLVEAECQLAEGKLDLVLLALSLSDQDKNALLCRWRRELPELSVIVLTADEETAFRGLASSTASHLVKGRFDSTHLACVIRSTLERRHLAQLLNEATQQLDEKPVAGRHCDDCRQYSDLQIQLAQSRKMATMGELAAGIAHEINTPTQFVGDNNRFLRDAFQSVQVMLAQCHRLLEASKRGQVTPQLTAEVAAAVEGADIEFLTEEIPQAIQQSLEGVNCIAKIVRAMKDFSHPDREGKQPCDLNRLADNALTVARNEWKYVAEVVTDFDPSLPLVHCLAGGISQVILNLIVNAAHAIDEATTAAGSSEKGLIKVSTRQIGDDVEIRISDTGSGIPETIRHRIFAPFFTTKGMGRGTGQGLAISHAVIVNQHGGTLDFESEVGRGTTFIVRVPIEDANAWGKSLQLPQEAAAR